MNLRSKVGIATLAVIIAVGGGSAAMSSGRGGSGSSSNHDALEGSSTSVTIDESSTSVTIDESSTSVTIEDDSHQRRGCANKDVKIARINARIARLNDKTASLNQRITALNEIKATVGAERVERFDKRIAKAQRDIGRVTDRITKETAARQKIEDRCATAPAP